MRLRIPEYPPDPGLRSALHEQIREVVRAVTGVRSSTLAWPAPGNNMGFAGKVEVGATGSLHEGFLASLTLAGPGYFAALGIPVLQGREFTASDADSPEAAVIVSRSLAERFFPSGGAVGGMFRRTLGAQESAFRVVGVVENARQSSPLTRTVGDAQIYLHLAARSARPGALDTASTSAPVDLLLLDAARVGAFVGELRDRLRPLGVDVDEDARFISIREQFRWYLDTPRFHALLFGAFAAVALALSLVGLYGVVSHAVESRKREMGIRLAIGASAMNVRRLVLLQGMVPVVVGIVAGLGGATAVVRLLAGMLYLVEPIDPPVFAAVPVLVIVVALAATWLPARVATRVDPVAIIRAEG